MRKPPSGEILSHLPETKQGLAASHEDQFRLLVEVIQDHAIFMLDTGGRVISWNLGAERLKDYRAAEIIGRHFSCLSRRRPTLR